MPDTIRDGQGRGFLAGVNKDNQLVTRTTSLDQRGKSAIDGNYYEGTTGLITLTDANETAMLYVKNDETDSNSFFMIDKIFVDVWASTGGAGGNLTIKYYRNPTVTGGSSADAYCTNFATSGTASFTLTKSLTTMTGDVWWIGQGTDSSAIAIDEGKFCVPPGYSFGVSITAPTSNSSMDVNINIAGYVLNTALL